MIGLPRSNLERRPPAHTPNHRTAPASLIDVKNARSVQNNRHDGCRMSALAQKRTFTALLDHLVGEREQERRNLKTQRFGGFDVEIELELRWSHDRQSGRICAIENQTCVDPGLGGIRWRYSGHSSSGPQLRRTRARNRWWEACSGRPNARVDHVGQAEMG